MNNRDGRTTRFTVWTVAGVLLVAASAGFAFTTVADHGKDSKGPERAYVGLGIGDHMILCPFGGSSPCLGGVTGEIGIDKIGSQWHLVDDQGDPVDSWEVWVHDVVWDEVNALDEDVRLKTAAFAQIRITATQNLEKDDPDTLQVCAAETSAGLAGEDWEETDVCVQETSKSSLRQTHNFGFCGQAGVEIDHEVIDPKKLNKDWDEVHAEKAVFISGPIFYQLDCPLLMDVEDLLVLVKQIGNKITCDQSWLDEDVDELVGCPIIFHDLAQIGSECFLEKQDEGALTLGVIGIVGTVGWQHDDPPKCLETPFHGMWTTGAGQREVVIKNSPLEDP